MKLTLGLAIGEDGDGGNDGGSGLGGLRLAVRGDGDSGNAGLGRSRRAGRGGARAGARDDVDVDQGALGSGVGVVQVEELAGSALVEVGGRAESDGAVVANGELAGVNATSLDGLVELELGVVGGNVTGAAVSVHQVSVVQVQGQDAGLAAGVLALAQVTVLEARGQDDGDLEVASVALGAASRGGTQGRHGASEGSEGVDSLHFEMWCCCC